MVSLAKKYTTHPRHRWDPGANVIFVAAQASDEREVQGIQQAASAWPTVDPLISMDFRRF